MLDVGIYTDLTSDEYHADTESISRSSLIEYLNNPFKYYSKYKKENAQRKAATKQMHFGSAYHTYILEPHLFNDFYAPKPPKVLLKNVGQEAFDEYKAYVKELESSNKIILSDTDFLTLKGMREALEADETAKALISNATYEKSFIWDDAHTGIRVKSRPDIMHGTDIYVDLKSTKDASPRAFQREMLDYGYDVQAAMVKDAVRVLEGKEVQKFIFLAQEKEYPFSIAVYELDDLVLEYGRQRYKQGLLDLQNDIDNNTFQDYGYQIINLPSWVS